MRLRRLPRGGQRVDLELQAARHREPGVLDPRDDAAAARVLWPEAVLRCLVIDQIVTRRS